MKVIQLHQKEKQLIEWAVENNRQAQQQIYVKFSPKMLSVCQQYIKDIHHAEDVMITGFMKVFTNWSCSHTDNIGVGEKFYEFSEVTKVGFVDDDEGGGQ